MFWICRGPEQRNHETSYALVHKIVDLSSDVLFIKRSDNLSERIDPLPGAYDQFARDNRLRLVLNCQIPPFGDPGSVHPLGASPDQNCVFMSFCHNQTETWALSLNQPVHGHCCGVPQQIDLWKKFLQIQIKLSGTLLNHSQKAYREVIRGRLRLFYDGLPFIIEHKIGKGSAYVNIYGIHDRTSNLLSTIASSPAAIRAFRLTRSKEMSFVTGCPSGRYSVSICTPHPGQ